MDDMRTAFQTKRERLTHKVYGPEKIFRFDWVQSKKQFFFLAFFIIFTFLFVVFFFLLENLKSNSLHKNVLIYRI